MCQFIRDNSLSLAMFGLFLFSLTGQIWAGHRYYNENRRAHQRAEVSYGEYLHSGDFVEAVFENWESEFLQMGLYVVLTAWLRQRGSSESKRCDGLEEVDEDPRLHRFDPNAPWPVKQGGWVLRIYQNSLSLVLLLLFCLSFALHAAGSQEADCEEQQQHGGSCVSMRDYFVSSRFWFESFQNWQSEFLSIGVLVLLSIWLRQQGSSQSKPVHSPHSETGD